MIDWVNNFIYHSNAIYIVQSITMVTCFLLYVWWSTWFSCGPLSYSYMCIVCKSIAQSLARHWMAKGTLPCVSYFGKRNQTSPMSTKFLLTFFFAKQFMLSRNFNISNNRFVLLSNMQTNMWPTCSFLNVTWVYCWALRLYVYNKNPH